MTTRIQEIIYDINRNQSTPSSVKRTMREVAKRQEEAIALSEAFTDANLKGNQLISGGAVWLTGLTFAVSDCVYVIDGELYRSSAAEVTLGVADGSNPRIDVIVVNIDGNAAVVAGTAAATPAKPETNPDTQVEVTFVTIGAAATTPTGVTATEIYTEDAEWTAAASGARIDDDDLSDPYAGTKAVKLINAINGDYITFTASAGVSPASIDTFSFYIKNVAVSSDSRNRLRFAWYNQATRVSNWINLRHGDYGYDAEDTAGYQFIQIPFGNFLPNGTLIDRLRVQVTNASGITSTLLLDNLKYQIGLPSVDTTDFAVLSRSNLYTKAQGSPITALTDAATVVWDMSPTNVYSLTIAGNRIIAAPTNIIPGYTYILLLTQDGVGTRTLTWNAVFKWQNGAAPTLSTGVTDIDVLTFIAGPTGNLHGSLGIANSV